MRRLAYIAVLTGCSLAPSERDHKLRTEVQAKTQMEFFDGYHDGMLGHVEMLYIPAGPYIHGRHYADDQDSVSETEPLAEVKHLDAFLIDRYEYPNRGIGRGDLPPIGTSGSTWIGAKATCDAAGKRLCTTYEWEKACKGPALSIYSYGNEYKPEPCKPHDEGGKHRVAWAHCANGYGVYHLSTGLREWTANSAAHESASQPVKGGLPGNPRMGTRCAYTENLPSSTSDIATGFRCCEDYE